MSQNVSRLWLGEPRHVSNLNCHLVLENEYFDFKFNFQFLISFFKHMLMFALPC